MDQPTNDNVDAAQGLKVLFRKLVLVGWLVLAKVQFEVGHVCNQSGMGGNV